MVLLLGHTWCLLMASVLDFLTECTSAHAGEEGYLVVRPTQDHHCWHDAPCDGSLAVLSILGQKLTFCLQARRSNFHSTLLVLLDQAFDSYMCWAITRRFGSRMLL